VVPHKLFVKVADDAQVLEAVVLPVVLLLLVCALLLYVQCCQHLSMPLLS
jgi:hypothetical protein